MFCPGLLFLCSRFADISKRTEGGVTCDKTFMFLLRAPILHVVRGQVLQVSSLLVPLLRRVRPLRPRDAPLLPGLRQFSRHAAAGIGERQQWASYPKYVTPPNK